MHKESIFRSSSRKLEYAVFYCFLPIYVGGTILSCLQRPGSRREELCPEEVPVPSETGSERRVHEKAHPPQGIKGRRYLRVGSQLGGSQERLGEPRKGTVQQRSGRGASPPRTRGHLGLQKADTVLKKTHSLSDSTENNWSKLYTHAGQREEEVPKALNKTTNEASSVATW